MVYIICFLVSFIACTLGKICGMGGGVIIKPVLDALSVAGVSAINFISGSTVIGMSCWSVGKSLVRKDSAIDLKVSTPLAIGAAIGGIIGKVLFGRITSLFSNPDTVGGIQASVLFVAVLGTMIYTIRKDALTSYHVKNPFLCILIGFALGMLGSFLGIGGGPFNVAVLYFFFSMTTKVAAQNSLYIILISQTAGMLKTFASHNVPEVSIPLLLGMIAFGVAGSELGGRLNKKLSEEKTTKLFEASMILVMGICIYNVFNYFRFPV